MASAGEDGRPRYWLIAAELREAIESGRYLPGARLPGENEVMKTHGVARGTARQALAQLVNWGLAEARKGSGIYVRDFRPIVREGIGRLGSSTWPSGASVWSTETEGRDLAVDQVEVSEADVPEHVRTLLGLEQGVRAVLRSRRYVLDGKPVLLSRSWLPAAIASGTPITQPRPAPAASTPASPTSVTPPRGSVRTSAPGCHCQPRWIASRSRRGPRSSRSAGSRLMPLAYRSRSMR